jgi:hypothetical protein
MLAEAHAQRAERLSLGLRLDTLGLRAWVEVSHRNSNQ